jgi:hypothetical protein
MLDGGDPQRHSHGETDRRFTRARGHRDEQRSCRRDGGHSAARSFSEQGRFETFFFSLQSATEPLDNVHEIDPEAP